MTLSLKQQAYDIWKSNLERKGISDVFKASFIKYIGVEDLNSYNNVLATLIHNANLNNAIIFDCKIPYEPDFTFIQALKQELSTMNLQSLETQDIKMFDDETFNLKYLKALQYVFNENRNLTNTSRQHSFLITMLLLTNIYLRTLIWDNYKTNKVIYYGHIEEQEFYFLLLCHLLDMDVLYINPSNDIPFNSTLIDTHKNTGILNIETLNSKVSKGTVLNQINSSTLSFEQNIEEQMFTNTGIFKPWQLRSHNPNNVLFNSNLIDLELNWTAQAKVREGFKVENNNVYIPNFFFEIEGISNNKDEYNKIIKKTRENSYIFSKNLPTDTFIPSYDTNSSGEIIFAFNGDLTLDKEKVKKFSFYKYDPYNDLTEDLIINKLNELIKSNTIYKNNLTKEEIINLTQLVLNLKVELIRLIDSFDFSAEIPKFVIHLNKDTSLSKEEIYVLGFLNCIGIDIVIFSPAGMSNISSYIDSNRFTSRRLDKMSYEENLDSITNKTKNKFSNLIDKLINI